MQALTKYINAYETAQGSPTEKVKSILMHYSHTWQWSAPEVLVADLLDDTRLTADDLVDFMTTLYEMDGGCDEVRSALHALDICLGKTDGEDVGAEDECEEDFVNEAHFYLRGKPLLDAASL